jgi:hypothetical protein
MMARRAREAAAAVSRVAVSPGGRKGVRKPRPARGRAMTEHKGKRIGGCLSAYLRAANLRRRTARAHAADSSARISRAYALADVVHAIRLLPNCLFE